MIRTIIRSSVGVGRLVPFTWVSAKICITKKDIRLSIKALHLKSQLRIRRLLSYFLFTFSYISFPSFSSPSPIFSFTVPVQLSGFSSYLFSAYLPWYFYLTFYRYCRFCTRNSKKIDQNITINDQII